MPSFPAATQGLLTDAERAHRRMVHGTLNFTALLPNAKENLRD